MGGLRSIELSPGLVQKARHEAAREQAREERALKDAVTQAVPHDLDAEAQVIWAAMHGTPSLSRLREKGLQIDHFYSPQWREVFASILAMADAGDEPNLVTVADHMARQGHDLEQTKWRLMAAGDKTPTPSVGIYAADLVIQHAARRHFISLGQQIAEKAWASPNIREVTRLLADAQAGLPAVFSGVQGSDEPSPLEEFGPFEERGWLVDQLFQEGWPGTLVAPGGSNKSTVALHLALSVAAGFDQWIGFAINNGKAAYVDFELDPRANQYRARKLALGLYGSEKIVSDLHYLSAREKGWNVSDVFVRLPRWIERHDYRLVVIDSLSIGMGSDPSEAAGVINLLNRQLAHLSQTETVVLLIDHPPKGQPGQAPTSAFGSAFKRNLGRSQLLMRSEKLASSTRMLTFVHDKANFGEELDPFSAKITFGHPRDYHDQGWVIERAEVEQSALAGSGLQGDAARVAAWLMAQPPVAHANAEIAEATGVTRTNITVVMTRLQDAGYASRVDRGAWRATDVLLERGRAAREEVREWVQESLIQDGQDRVDPPEVIDTAPQETGLF